MVNKNNRIDMDWGSGSRYQSIKTNDMLGIAIWLGSAVLLH